MFFTKRVRIRISPFLALTLALAEPASAALDIVPLWTANPDMVMEGAPMVVDLDGDGDDEILTAAYENIIVVDGTGEELWRFDTRGRYSTCPAILERAGESPVIYAGDNKGMFTCLNGQGEVVWQRDMGTIFCASPMLADLDQDGRMEVVQGDQAGLLSALDALTGDVLWATQLEGGCSCPAAADINGDGRLEVVLATDQGKTLALDADGNPVWEFGMGATAPFWAIASPVVFADAQGRLRVATASHDGNVFCLDNNGTLLWQRTTRGAIACTLSVGDIDADGKADVFAVSELGVLYRFDEDGRVLWDIDTQGRSLASGAIIDLDGDGTLEYVLCTQRGTILAFSDAGEMVYNYQFDNRTINVTLAFGDIVKERAGLEFAVTGGESGQIFCFGIEAPDGAMAQWTTYRGDNRLTGAWLDLTAPDVARMTPENLNWDEILTGGDVTFRIANPAPDTGVLTAQAACVRPDGSRQLAVGKVAGRQGLLKLPVSATAPGVFRFEWVLKSGNGGALASGARELTLDPYQNDQALARRAILAIEEVAGPPVDGPVTGLRAALQQEAQGIEEEADALAELQTAAPGSTPAFRENLDTRTEALNARATRALTLADLAPPVLANENELPFVVFQGITWENRDVDKALPSESGLAQRIERRCVPGEHEPVSLKVLNVTPEPLAVQVRVEPETGGPSVKAYEVRPVPTNQGTVAWDPMVPLGNKELQVPPLETREVWLDAGLAAVAPGMHEVGVVISAGGQETKTQLAFDVLPFEMAGPGAMRLCCWSRYNEDAVKDLLAHGNTVFTASLPPVEVTDGQPVKLDIDYAALDEFAGWMQGHDVFLLMGGIPNLGVPMESEEYVPRFARYLDDVFEHLAEKGIDEDHIALYPHDEPGGHGWDTVNHYVAFGRQGLKARPGLKFYVNGGGDLAMFEALNEVAAIWCPGFYAFSADTPEMRFLKESGKTLWSYDCGYSYARPIGANTKTINIVGQYRLAAVFGLHFGTTGIGYWCYNAGDSMWDAVEHEYPLVYANPDGTHTSSRRWEAVREGMEDARILIALRDMLQSGSVDREAKEKIRHLLDKTVAGISEQSLKEVHLGVARYVLDNTNDDQAVEQLRDEMMDCVALVSGKTN